MGEERREEEREERLPHNLHFPQNLTLLLSAMLHERPNRCKTEGFSSHRQLYLKVLHVFLHVQSIRELFLLPRFVHCSDTHCPRVFLFNAVCAVVLFLSFVVYTGSFGSEQSSQILAFSAGFWYHWSLPGRALFSSLLLGGKIAASRFRGGVMFYLH